MGKRNQRRRNLLLAKLSLKRQKQLKEPGMILVWKLLSLSIMNLKGILKMLSQKGFPLSSLVTSLRVNQMKKMKQNQKRKSQRKRDQKKRKKKRKNHLLKRRNQKKKLLSLKKRRNLIKK